MRFKFAFFAVTILLATLSFGQTTQLRTPDCNRVNTTLNKIMYAANASADAYWFKLLNTETGVTDSVLSSTRSFAMNDAALSNVTYNCVFDVQVKMSFDGGSTFGSYGPICNPETIALVTTLRTPDCGRSLNSISQTLYANVNVADSWDFEVRNVTDPATTEIVNTPTRAFNLAMTTSTNFQLLSQEYQIRVRTTQEGVLQPFGAWCSVFTPTIVTELRPSDCGRILTDIDYPVYAQVADGDSYEFEIRNVNSPLITEIVSTPTREFRLTMADAQYQLFNEEYEIRVRAIYNGVTMPFGGWCSVFSPPSNGPEITSGCGNTFEYLAYEYLTCEDISATQYEWLLRIGSTFVDTLFTTTNQARLADFLDAGNLATYNYGQTYNIAVRGEVSGIWTPYGTGCSISTTANAHTEVQHLCGAQLNSFNTPISVFAIFNATNYEFEVTDLTGGDGVQNVNKTVRKVKLNELSQYSYGHEYSIRCRVTFKGIQYDWSTACSVTAPQPITQLRPSDCPRALSTMNKKVYANPLIFDLPNGLDPVESYRFRIAGNESAWKSTRDITLIEILGSAPAASTSYTIEVRAKYDGVEQSYGPGCTVTTPSSIILNDEPNEADMNLMKSESLVNIYPNPSDDYFIVSPLKSIHRNVLNYEVHDLNGRLMESVQAPSAGSGINEIRLGRSLPNGIYFIYIFEGDQIKEVKKIRKL